VSVLVAPIIPFLTDRFIEQILQRSFEAGAKSAGYVLIRLPHEVAPIFKEWLDTHYPAKAAHIMSLIHQMRGGKDYDSRWGIRQSGEGEFARLLSTRFRLAKTRFGGDQGVLPLDRSQFVRPGDLIQPSLF
jgi:DNA repair photolyase